MSNPEGLSLQSNSLSGLLGAVAANRKQVVRAGQPYEVWGETLQHIELGGRTLSYDTLEFAGERTRVLLTIAVPAGCVYEVESPLFDVPPADEHALANLSVDVHATGAWTKGSGLLRLDCSGGAGEITFIFESSGSPHPVARIAIVCTPGRELDAVVARAALGSDFVPAFVLPHPSLWTTVLSREMFDRAIILPSGRSGEADAPDLVFGEAIRHSAPLREALGLAPRIRKIVAPEIADLLGPALAIAVACDAELQLEPSATEVKLLEGETVLASWGEETLVGKLMPDLGGLAVLAPSVGDELVLCEATIKDLLIIQAVGYAVSHRLPIAFLREPSNESASEAATFETFRNRAECLVPPPLRAPSQSALTVFTRTIPLHLVRRNEAVEWPAGHWATSHIVSHLPGQTASVLIPRWFSDEMERVMPLPLSVFYNGLGAHGQKDGASLGSAAGDLLNHLMTLDGGSAKTDVLRETLERLPTSMVLIAAHGAERVIELERGRHVRDTEIGNWRLAGSPVVFNNSCSSWTQLGQAFLQAGARAYVGTLWEVSHEAATEVATTLLQHMLAAPGEGIASALAVAVSGESTSIDHGSYIYVGLPQASARIERPLNRFERLETAALALHRLYGLLHRLIDDGRTSIARHLQPSVHDTVVAGFSGLVEPDDPVPLRLPPPFTGTVLDLGYIIGTADVQALRRIANASPTEEQEALLTQCLSSLDNVIDDLSNLSERHQAFQAARATGADSGRVFMNAGVEDYRLLVQTAYEVVLPLAKDCCDISMKEAAERLVALASFMVTISSDIAEGTPPSASTVLQRIRQGVPYKAQVYGTGEQIEIDQLDNAVNRSDLANRFGIALRGLGYEMAAVAFFELAMELAKRGSPDEFNARANRWRQADPLGQLPQLFEEQLAAGDLDNASITGANLLREAGAARHSLSPDLLGKIESLPDRVPGAEAHASAECQLLGSLAIYHAALGHMKEAEACTDRVGDRLYNRLVMEPGGLARATVSARALFEYLHDTGSYDAACQEGAKVTHRLTRAELLEEALRTHFAVCVTAIDGYNATRSNRFLAAFLKHSASAGRLVRDRPALADDLPEMVDSVAENTTGIWHQAEANGQIEVALLAYDAQRLWRNGVSDPAWELLRAARSEHNLAAVKALAAAGDLCRSAIVVIDDEFSVTAEVTTSRSAGAGSSVISTWPLSPHSASCSHDPPNAFVVAQSLVTPLASGGRSTVSETGLPHLSGDGRGAYLYSDMWGSRIFEYTVVLRLPGRLLPRKIRLEGVPRDSIAIDIRFVQDGCEVRVVPRDAGDRWMGRLDVYCFDLGDTRFPFTAPDGPLGNWIPVEFFEDMMDLLGRSQESKTEASGIEGIHDKASASAHAQSASPDLGQRSHNADRAPSLWRALAQFWKTVRKR
ncbi:CHAT domain-containing protein [Rhizobium ruizarguesonis]